jgi:doublecortin-like kinase 1/2
LNGAIRCIYSTEGKKVEKLDDLEDNKSYVCSCNNEIFKKIDYSSNSLIKTAVSRMSKNGRPSSPMKNGTNGTVTKDEVSVVFPRIVTLVRNGVKPRKIMRLLLNKRNSPTFDHILSAITQVVKLDSGCVRKVFKLDGTPVTKLAEFFDTEDVFFAYGNERVGGDDFDLDVEEGKSIKQMLKTLKTGAARNGPKPKMPVKSHNDTFAANADEEQLENGGIRSDSLPPEVQKRFVLGQIIGDGNFAVVLKLKDKMNSECDFALKIIDKSKCKGKVSDYKLSLKFFLYIHDCDL